VITLVTDSSSQIPASLIDRYNVHVVPIPLTVDGHEHHEGVDLAVDELWDRFRTDPPPDITTSQPSPGEIADIYQTAINAGATEIISIHVSRDVSGTWNSATLAADMFDTEIHVVDSGTASFGITACLWDTAIALETGATATQAAQHARTVAPTIGTSFILQGLDFAHRSGRFNGSLPEQADDIIVLSGHGTNIEVTGTGRTVDELCDQMAAQFLAANTPIRVGIGIADPATIAFADGLETRLRASPNVIELTRYRVGPSIAAHTGPGTAGGFWWPAR